VRRAEQPGGTLRGRVLVTWVGYDPEHPGTGGRLAAAGLDVALAPKLGARTSAELASLARDAVAAIVSTDPFDHTVFEAAPRLRVVARVGVGTDSIDLDAATASGVVVTTTPGANQETTADHALAMILAAVRRLAEHDAAVRRGEWPRAGDLTPAELHGTTVGLIGYGAIGRAVGRRLAGFGVELLVHDPALDGGADSPAVPLRELLRRADVISLHCPLTAATRGMLGRRELATIRPGGILVNTSRGGLVDEEALADALAGGRLAGAALDVFADEPRVPRALSELPSVVLTPHIGGLSVRSIRRMTEAATTQVLAVLRGQPPGEGVVNPAALSRAGAVA
jgi:phosphoglycerate dehydrogenase-like enzyme